MRATRYYLSLVAFFTGITVAPTFDFSYPTFSWLLVLAIVAALTWRRTEGGVALVWLSVSLILTFFVLGAWRFSFHDEQFGQSVLQAEVGKEVVLEGAVMREPEVRETSLHLYVKVGDDTVLVTTDRYATFTYGDVVRIEGLLEEPDSFTTEFGRTFDYPRYLLVRDVEYLVRLGEVAVLGQGEGNHVIAVLLSIKQRFLKALNKSLPEPESGLGAGVLLGVKQALGESLERAFRETGIIHIVVLSGYNIMLVVTFITFIFGSFFSLRTRVIGSLLAIACFAIMVGLSATVLRACVMAAILLIAQVAHRRYMALRALMLAGFIMLMINPYLLNYDIGFQLSFVATLGLILLSPYVEQVCFWAPKRFAVREFLAATISTQIAVLPLLMFHIGEVSLVSVVVNLLVLPIVPIAMMLSFLVGVIALVFPTFAWMLSPFAYASLHYIVVIASKFATLPLAAVPVPEFSLVGLGLFYSLYALVMWYLLLKYPIDKPSISENGEAFVLEGPKSSAFTDTSLSGWTIVEEIDDILERQSEQKSTAASKAAVPDSDTPIFFR
jgi:competence protein ComEC